MSRAVVTKRIAAILPINKDCLTLMFKDGTNETLTYRELRDLWNEMNGYKTEAVAPKDLEKASSSRSKLSKGSIAPVREPVAHSKYPKLHPLATPRTISYES